MSSLSDFSKNFTPKKKEEKTTQPQSQEEQKNFKSQNTNIEEDVKKQYNKFSGMNQNEMMSELFKETNRLKQNGQFNYEALVGAIDNMSGMLSEEQKHKMKELLKQFR